MVHKGYAKELINAFYHIYKKKVEFLTRVLEIFKVLPREGKRLSVLKASFSAIH